ncbi:MAG: hypothetical protein NFW16_11890 [Candidatus Accumulibacter sp.]|uniref:hypothetical protein n=1 Tax=Accumulibacter sp. TaxID=2053492 RepID=UPI00258F989D|nr:hypothetical protein [Accumulibacter sp.]MCM8622406.1 hypothetical protein [Accumulibacter sp.]
MRAYFGRLDEAWRYWFFFLSQADESIELLESGRCETVEVVPGVTSADMERLERSLALRIPRQRVGVAWPLPAGIGELWQEPRRSP